MTAISASIPCALSSSIAGSGSSASRDASRLVSIMVRCASICVRQPSRSPAPNSAGTERVRGQGDGVPLAQSGPPPKQSLHRRDMAVGQAPLDQVAICRYVTDSKPGEHSQHGLAHPPRAGAKLGARRLDFHLLVDGGNGFEIHACCDAPGRPRLDRTEPNGRGAGQGQRRAPSRRPSRRHSPQDPPAPRKKQPTQRGKSCRRTAAAPWRRPHHSSLFTSILLVLSRGSRRAR